MNSAVKLRWQSVVVGLAAIIFFLADYKIYLPSFLKGQWPPSWAADDTAYNRAVLATNYFDDGFVHRGLGGTIDLLLSRDSLTGGLLFNLVSLVLLAVPLCILLVRLSRKLKPQAFLYMTAIVALSPQTFLGWSRDMARTDLLVIAAIAWAVLATLVNRRALAVIILLVGFLVHETALIFGAPLLFALNLQAWRRSDLSFRRGAALVAILMAGIVIIYFAQSALSAPVPVVVAHMLQRFPPQGSPLTLEMRDSAIYFAVAGGRGLKTAFCYNLSVNGQYVFMAVLSFVVLAVYAVMLGLQKKPLATVVAVFLPMIFMLAIANDTGRWLKLAVMNAWLLAAALQDLDPEAAPLSPRTQIFGAIGLVVLLLMGPTQATEVNRLSRIVAEKLGMGYPGLPHDWLTKCDPTWRALVAPTPPAGKS